MNKKIEYINARNHGCDFETLDFEVERIGPIVLFSGSYNNTNIFNIVIMFGKKLDTRNNHI